MSNTDFDMAEFQARVNASIYDLEKILPTIPPVRGASESKSLGGAARETAASKRSDTTRPETGNYPELPRRLLEIEAELVQLKSIEAKTREKETLERRMNKAEEKQRRRQEAEKERQRRENVNSLDQARELVKRKDIRTTLCPALRSVSHDAYDIGKLVIPLLSGAILGHQIIMPLDPLLFAGISLVIARMGISTICAGYGDEDKKRDSQ